LIWWWTLYALHFYILLHLKKGNKKLLQIFSSLRFSTFVLSADTIPIIIWSSNTANLLLTPHHPPKDTIQKVFCWIYWKLAFFDHLIRLDVCQEIYEKCYTQKMPSLMTSKGHWNSARHISVFWIPVSTLFSTFLAAGSLSDKRMEMLDTFYIAFKDTNRGFKGKVDLNKEKLAQKVHLSFNLIYSYMNCRKCVIKSCPWHLFLSKIDHQFLTCTAKLNYYLLSYLNYDNFLNFHHNYAFLKVNISDDQYLARTSFYKVVSEPVLGLCPQVYCSCFLSWSPFEISNLWLLQ